MIINSHKINDNKYHMLTSKSSARMPNDMPLENEKPCSLMEFFFVIFYRFVMILSSLFCILSTLTATHYPISSACAPHLACTIASFSASSLLLFLLFYHCTHFIKPPQKANQVNRSCANSILELLELKKLLGGN